MVNDSELLSITGELENLQEAYGRELSQTFESISTKEMLLEQIKLGQTWSNVEAAHRERGHDFVYHGIAFIVNLVRQVSGNPDYEAAFGQECMVRKIGKPDTATNSYTPYLAAVFGNWEGTETDAAVWVRNKSWTNLGGVVRHLVENHVTPHDVVNYIKAAKETDDHGEERTRLEALKIRDRKAHPPKVNSEKRRLELTKSAGVS